MAINVFIASGNLGNDCKVAVTPNGKSIATFSLPVKSGYGENEKTSWVTCKMFGKRAESQLPNFLKKGVKVTVTGEFILEEWTPKPGTTNKMPVILVNNIDFVSQNSQNLTHKQNNTSNTARKQTFAEAVDDDIPF